MPPATPLRLQVNAGSVDSSGLKSRISINPPGPYKLGKARVTLTISNPLASARCTGTVTVLVRHNRVVQLRLPGAAWQALPLATPKLAPAQPCMRRSTHLVPHAAPP